jgi:hypothetical protein
MQTRHGIPTLHNPNVVIRLARGPYEVEKANEIVCRSYVEAGYWDDDRLFQTNPHMFSPMRTVFVVEDRGRLVGTASIVRDSSRGLPVDKAHAPAIDGFRDAGECLAEVSALAIEKECAQQRTLVLFLFKYVYQYSFYFAGIDRFLIATNPRHAAFYRAVYCFDELPGGENYNYAKPDVRLLLMALPLLLAHKQYYDRYEAGMNSNSDSFYRFMLVNEHPNLKFPDRRFMQRHRDVNWLAQAQAALHRLARAG